MTTLAAQALLDGEVEAITRKAIELALDGDIQALRLCLDRIIPPIKERPIGPTKLPDLKTGGDTLEAIQFVVHELVAGELLPADAVAIANILEQFRRHHESAAIEERIKKLEQMMKGKPDLKRSRHEEID